MHQERSDLKRALHRAALCALPFIAACASSGGSAAPHVHEPEPVATSAHDHHAMTAMPATAGPGYTVADVEFMQHMIGHHAQALVMTAMVPERGSDENVQRLAQKIDISQRDEIALMRQWLEERGQAVPDTIAAMNMQMPGMLTPAQMEQLRAARGTAFDRLFLILMIQHHRGALAMVDVLDAAPGANQDSDIFRFVTDVVTDQSDEIDVMYRLLDLLPNPGGQSR